MDEELKNILQEYSDTIYPGAGQGYGRLAVLVLGLSLDRPFWGVLGTGLGTLGSSRIFGLACFGSLKASSFVFYFDLLEFLLQREKGLRIDEF